MTWAELAHAVVPPYAARWLLAQAARGPVTLGSMRAEALRLRQAGRPDLASQLELGSAQLRMSARAWVAACDRAAADELAALTSEHESAPAEMPAPAASSMQAVSVTAAEAAHRLGVTPQRVGQLLRSGRLPGRRIGRVWLVERAAVEAAREERLSA